MPSESEQALTLRVHRALAEIPEAGWRALTEADPAAQPFLEWGWLEALEATGCVGPATGWDPRHLALYRGGALVGVAPAYRKSGSQGEYVFDWSWASAAERAGIPYYPKLVLAVPFTPATGRRILCAPGEDRSAIEQAIVDGATNLAREEHLSGVHVLFPTESEARAFETMGLAIRHGVQYHWRNAGYRTYDEFLARFTSKRRNQLRRERRAADAQGIEIRTRRGAEISPDEADTIHALYRSNVDRHVYGRPYLNLAFFRRVLDRFAGRIELVEARREGRIVAGAFNVAAPNALYGRYWGCFEHHAFLHFHVCLYHSIDECIRRGTERFEGGAGGEHKLGRGFEPAITRSAHRLLHPALDRAVQDFVEREREAVARLAAEDGAAAGLKALDS